LRNAFSTGGHDAQMKLSIRVAPEGRATKPSCAFNQETGIVEVRQQGAQLALSVGVFRRVRTLQQVEHWFDESGLTGVIPDELGQLKYRRCVPDGLGGRQMMNRSSVSEQVDLGECSTVSLRVCRTLGW
jgi:hypothetical protein